MDSFDIALDNDRDIIISGGDLSLTESSEELLYALINSVTGDYKLFNVAAGINLQSQLNSPLNSSTISLKRKIEADMKADGFKTTDLVVTGSISQNKMKIQTSGERLRA